jgi:hypothetical protein
MLVVLFADLTIESTGGIGVGVQRSAIGTVDTTVGDA